MQIIVGVLSFNHPHLTLSCIESVPKDCPVLLVHNGSSRENVELIKSKTVERNFLHIVIEENKGFTGGINRLLTEAFQSFDVCLFLSNDTKVLQFDLAEIAHSKDSVGVPQIKYRSGKVASIGAKVNLSNKKLIHCKSKEEFECDSEDYNRYVPGASFAISKNVFQKVGPFDESLHTYWEDVDWSLRATSLGVDFKVLKGTVIEHGVAKTTRKDPFYSNYLFHRNKEIVCSRWSQKPVGRSAGITFVDG
ncbi:MAG: hypothetical protein COT74_05610 [Bdellovibrionales bacterium CG10_big_fil_rev_8_21_14_0_10_45_34]|nr:MAG: hypothetical protein COT74_05610 [Bdellovibrionales bacterium CG10_big_fil_rev_8_21_14_0_10_45_34]